MNPLDSLLSRLTMYRLMLYYLISLVVIATILAAAGLLPGLHPVSIGTQALILLPSCYLANLLFSRLFRVPTNLESTAITALILTLIVGPFTPRSLSEVGLLFFLAFVAMSSKYLLVIHKRHFFNPAALAVVLSAILFHQGASWWIGSSAMLPFLLLGGIIALCKLRRFTLVLVFLIVTTLLSLSPANLLSPAPIFFSSVMLIEPQTSPVFTKFQILYAIIVALLLIYLPAILPISYPLELSLLIGNIFSYMAESTSRFSLQLQHKLQLTPDIWAFYFRPEKKINFIAGQYLELTLSHPRSDNRGIRRFFTIASSPTEPEIMIVSRFSNAGSSFKNALLNLRPGDTIFANGPSGEFTLPALPDLRALPIVFIAGGIGITPFRSIVKYLLDTDQHRDITLLYSAKTEDDFVFNDLFVQAAKIGIKTVYRAGHLDEETVQKETPDYKNHIFHVSGPEPMVQATEKILENIGVSRSNIKCDYFPGY